MVGPAIGKAQSLLTPSHPILPLQLVGNSLPPKQAFRLIKCKASEYKTCDLACPALCPVRLLCGSECPWLDQGPAQALRPAFGFSFDSATPRTLTEQTWRDAQMTFQVGKPTAAPLAIAPCIPVSSAYPTQGLEQESTRRGHRCEVEHLRFPLLPHAETAIAMVTRSKYSLFPWGPLQVFPNVCWEHW